MRIRENGVVRTFMTERGFGFIRRIGCPPLYFNRAELREEDIAVVRAGTPISFIVTTDQCGRLQASSIEVLDRTAGAIRPFGIEYTEVMGGP